ncbi:MAG: hypothetical protein KGH55_03240 [Nanoarchaeota archaeon]|nr:hypothetical protein [Nanoarchaeota archaeon]
MENIRSKLQDIYGRKEISKLQDIVKDAFRDYFLSKGYIYHDPAPLISPDKTVIFTCSSTNIVKPIIISGDYPPANGFIITQECLRNHALKHAFDNNWLPFGQAYFNMSTILSKPSRFKEVVAEASEFTVNTLGVNPSEVIIKSTKKLDELRDIDKYTPIHVEYDTNNGEYYDWTYGIPEMYGEGVTISIRNSVDDSYLDVGNIVRILDYHRNERGIEFGYGHEFLLSTLLGIENPLSLSPIFELFPFHPDLSSKYYGYLEVIARIKKAKANLTENRGAGGIYRKYLKSFQYMGNALGKDIDTMISEISRYYEHISSQPVGFSLEQKLLKNIIRKVN